MSEEFVCALIFGIILIMIFIFVHMPKSIFNYKVERLKKVMK